MAKISFLASLPDIQGAIRFGGDGCRIQLDVPESESQNAVALIALKKTVLRVTVEVDGARQPEAPAKKEKPGKGPHGQFWAALIRKCYYADPGLLEILDQNGYEAIGDDDHVAEALRELIGVESRTQISPERFEQFCEMHQLHNLVSMSRQIVAKMESGK